MKREESRKEEWRGLENRSIPKPYKTILALPPVGITVDLLAREYLFGVSVLLLPPPSSAIHS